ncbi:type VI secretion system Vgr family protein [Pseudomonas gingeri]|uniref:type VI secretion system Vgr family protein n=1 Tax=Pseudomonas gingeri TaxID=117681 RepID=UPI0015A23922|nr:type VI secretion system Vgr family protein [Pseudomonas gingeri]NWA05005.1 type VI secretion system tip protein VgrG [Pseudomonas gingeri]NWA17173.1 type VI secretion system tip protein VgrG [Pseudomonas gingeri]NWA59098.1 type VI secretion system tip protein VgrG [Pseudomonas gingeri]NWA99647.1 type VI secretion system tip protein VgrG [Pseudomonas gingeri]NWB06155.1 type VI secretion system tip protein VgrG [Pseudomonas gingeri]
MSSPPPTFFDHSRHKLWVRNLDITLDVLAFTGNEGLSQRFNYRVEFTAPDLDIPAEKLLGQDAGFSLYTAPHKRRKQLSGFPTPEVKPLRTLYGVITDFNRLSASRDEARYEIVLQPRLALLDRGKQWRIYQHQSVPEIVEKILRGRHAFEGYEFHFRLIREYPRREQVMQYDESDLAFIERLLADVGIWYCFSHDDRVRIAVVEFHDDQRGYQYDIELPYLPPSGLSSSDEDAVWQLQSRHRVVEQTVNLRAYDYRDAKAWLDGEVDQTDGGGGGATTTYGEAYHYGEPYSVLGNPLLEDEDLQSESGYFYARLRHERYLNAQTQLSGASSSATLAPGQMLDITGGAPQAFARGAVITQLSLHAARDRSLEVTFQAIPYTQRMCFRPPLPPKRQIAGTLPARISNPKEDDPYAEIDFEGRYRVRFLFDRDPWPTGHESAWLRLARPYAGDTHGLHLPLIAGTEVAVAFEQGDPDRPYIAYALHDSLHPDHVTLARRDDSRNVLRTPANNKLRMEDKRGQEHVKLSTEYAGKSQLNLGHLVDAGKQKRGDGFELRSDGWGAIRAGKGLLISADEQTRAKGQQLDMEPATALLQGARQQMTDWREIAQAHHSRQPDLDGLGRLQADAKDLSAPAMLLSAPNGIGTLTPASLLLNSGEALYLQSQAEINLAAAGRLSAHAGQGISLLARQEGMRLVSGQGPLEIESHADVLKLIAQQDIDVQSVQGHLQLTARNGITLGCGGGYIRITPSGEIQIHGPGLISIKGRHLVNDPTEEVFALPELPGSVCKDCLKKARAAAQGFVRKEIAV